GEAAEATEQYRAVIASKPEYVAAHMALAELLTKSGDTSAALEQLQAASRLQPDNAAVRERIGDIERERGRTAEAGAAWQAALERTGEGGDKKRIAKKIRSVVGQASRPVQPPK